MEEKKDKFKPEVLKFNVDWFDIKDACMQTIGKEAGKEPNDEWKGDFARIYFYALARWNNSENWTSGDGSVVFSGSLSKNCGLTDYALNLFLKWHDQDPVSEYERVKNAEAFKLQKNRNPFVDFPQFVDSIWR